MVPDIVRIEKASSRRDVQQLCGGHDGNAPPAALPAHRAHPLTSTPEHCAPGACGRTIGSDSLTPSERRVVELAATGDTNRQIAQTLFVTEKTVETHMGRAFRKLEVSSRRQLPDALAGVVG